MGKNQPNSRREKLFTCEQDRAICYVYLSITQDPTIAADHDRIKDSPGRTEETGDRSDTRDNVDSLRRKKPIGRKTDKASRKKSKIGDPDNVRVCNLMEEFNKNFSENAKNRMEQEERKIKIMEDLKRIEENKVDERIMAMDISNMDQQRQVYYQLRRNEIMNRVMSQSSFFAPPSQLP